MKSYKVSIVNYLNSALFVEGLNGLDKGAIDLELDNPAMSARKLLNNEVDIALAPVAILSQMPEHYIVSDYCIGTKGQVQTVKIFSDVPIQEVKRIYLDYQSRTSVQLATILCQHYWKIQPELLPAYPGFQKDIVHQNAGLIIGDRAIRVLGKYKFEYDLGEEWFRWQQLPFVFAVWIANKKIDEVWLEQFNNHLALGLKQKDLIVDRYKHLDTDAFSVKKYIHQYIDYNFDEDKKKALDLFQTYL
ncbi:MAG: menaquinone biosynthesis protein [Bacteroidetes bacterium]|nr:menaquinone biosynthesis protein [Bacteroidota bacterium]